MWRGKDPKKIVNELMDLRNIYPNVNQFRFVDADFIGSGKYSERLLKIGQELIKQGFSLENAKIFIETQSDNALSVPPNVWEVLRKAGLHQVFIGIENGDDRIKKYLAKRSSFDEDLKAIDYLKNFGFNVTYGFIMINPWSDMKNILQNAEILKSLGNAGLDKYFSELILNPGTRAFEMVNEENGIYVEKIDGTDRYLFPLPNSVESLRQINKNMLEHPRYKLFLERTASLYSRLDEMMLNGKEADLLGLKDNLDTMNLEIFLKITEKTQLNSNVLSAGQIDNLLSVVLQEYWPKLLALSSQIVR